MPKQPNVAPEPQREGLTAEAFPTVEVPRAADNVTRALIDGFRSGAHIGARLPRDHELAVRFGVGRAVIRAAIDRLRRAGMLDVRRGNGGGATVRSLAIPLDLLTERRDLPREEIRHLLEARRALETATAELAAKRATEADLHALRDLAEHLAPARADPIMFIEFDIRFHLRLATASGNNELVRFLAETFRDLSAVRASYPTRYGSMATAEAYQFDTLDALSARNQRAVSASIDRHLAGLEEHFLGQSLSRAASEP